MKLWTSTPFCRHEMYYINHWWVRTKYARANPGSWNLNSVLCGRIFRSLLEPIPDGSDIWLVMHDCAGPNRLRITVAAPQGVPCIYADGHLWGWPLPWQERLLRRLGLIGGRRKALWLEVSYREPERSGP